nr:hypothetical protein [Rhodococcus fascians]
MSDTVIVAGARTPIGKLAGALASPSAVELGAHAISRAPARAGVSAELVDAVIIGNVVQAGVGPNPARQAEVAAGLPLTTTAITITICARRGFRQSLRLAV